MPVAKAPIGTRLHRPEDQQPCSPPATDANFRIKTAEVEAVVQELADATRRLATSLESLQSAEQRFREANSGRAVEAFTVAQQSWTQGHSEMTQALLLAKQRLQEILHHYLSADSSSAAIFSGQ